MVLWYSTVVDSSTMVRMGCRAAAKTSELWISPLIVGRMCWKHSFCRRTTSGSIQVVLYSVDMRF